MKIAPDAAMDGTVDVKPGCHGPTTSLMMVSFTPVLVPQREEREHLSFLFGVD